MSEQYESSFGPVEPGAERVGFIVVDGTVTLWRPVGVRELSLIADSGWKVYPERLPEQPIFYPVLSEEYAVKIAEGWNVPHGGVGFVTKFRVEAAYVERFPIRQAGGSTVLELWVPAVELEEFNAHIVGEIAVTRMFTKEFN
jgi:hypothetical protein